LERYITTSSPFVYQHLRSTETIEVAVKRMVFQEMMPTSLKPSRSSPVVIVKSIYPAEITTSSPVAVAAALKGYGLGS
jgi:hypothetical protein